MLFCRNHTCSQRLFASCSILVDDVLLGSHIDALVHLRQQLYSVILLSFLQRICKLLHHGFHEGLVWQQPLVAGDTLLGAFDG